MNIHIVHLPVLQSLAWQIRMCAHDLAFLSLLTSLCLRHVFWKPSGFFKLLFLELDISLHPLQTVFNLEDTNFPLGILRFDHEDSCSLDMSYLLPCTFRYYF